MDENINLPPTFGQRAVPTVGTDAPSTTSFESTLLLKIINLFNCKKGNLSCQNSTKQKQKQKQKQKNKTTIKRTHSLHLYATYKCTNVYLPFSSQTIYRKQKM